MTTIRGEISAAVPMTHKAGDAVLFSWISAEDVPPRHRGMVEGHVRRIARWHKLGGIVVHYFGPPTDSGELHEIAGTHTTLGDFAWTAPDDGGGTILGIAPETEGNEIAVRADLRGRGAIAYVVAHEMAHLMRRASGLEPSEDDAHDYAARYVRRIGLA